MVSYLGFRSGAFEERYIFDPQRILAGKEYYRLVTAGFLHADWGHLLLNMVSLYLFGNLVEANFGAAQFLLIYFGAVIGGNLLALYVHRQHEYRAYGASGGVCGIIFAFILLFPGARISPFYFTLPVPGWLYAIGYLVISIVGMKAHNQGGIGHDAHLGGAIVGLLLTAGLHPDSLRNNLKVFLLVLGAAVCLLVYLWLNPLFLSAASFASFFRRSRTTKARSSNLPKNKHDASQIDRILDKIAKTGLDSLTAEEKKLLGEASGKYQRRAESEKPDSGLAI